MQAELTAVAVLMQCALTEATILVGDEAHRGQRAGVASELDDLFGEGVVIQDGRRAAARHPEAVHVAVAQRHLRHRVITRRRKIIVQDRPARQNAAS